MVNTLKKIAYTIKPLFCEGFYGSKNITYKGTVDLVTEYDKKIDDILVTILSKEFPEFTIVGEESWTSSSYPSKAIFIDPIDGTTNYVHGIPHTAISIGVWDNVQPIAGIVYNPILDEMFWATQGKGAYLNEQQLYASHQTNLQDSLVATGFPYTKVDKGADLDYVVKQLQHILPLSRDVRRLGAASLDLCYTAKGTFDLFYEINLKPWDIAAGAIIAQEAGCFLKGLQHSPFNLYGKGIVVGDKHLLDSLSEWL